MRVITSMKFSEGLSQLCIALGTFDGVHLGHQRVIRRAIECAKNIGGKSAVFTFANHPLSVLAPDRCPLLITSAEDKQQLLDGMGVDILCRIPFDKQLLQLSPSQFVEQVLSNFQPSHIIVGPNYTFGYKGTGTPELLEIIGREKGFSVEVQEAVYVDGQMVSSTSIRQYIGHGNVEKAANLMGRPFRRSGTVVHGDHRGRILGFPTANMQLAPSQLLPGDGVYAVYATIGKQRLPALANVGDNPTFSQQCRRVEVYILDFTADVYGQTISVDFYSKLRSEQTFSTIDELKKRIALDVAEARQFFASR